jgi:hypothetical protein
MVRQAVTTEIEKPQYFQRSGDLARRSKNAPNEVTIHRSKPEGLFL